MSWGRNFRERIAGGEMSPGRKTGGERLGAKHPDPIFNILPSETESVVAVCGMLLKFNNLSAKFAFNFNKKNNTLN